MSKGLYNRVSGQKDGQPAPLLLPARKFLDFFPLSRSGSGELDIPPGMIIAGTNVKADSGRFFIAETRSLPPQLRASALLREGEEEEEEEKRIYLSWTRGDATPCNRRDEWE